MPPPLPKKNQPRITTRELFRQFPGTLRLVVDAAPGKAAALAALTLAQGALPAGIAYVGKIIVDRVVLSVQNPGEASRGAVLQAVLLELGLVLVSTLLTSVESLVREQLRAQLGNAINERILQKALQLPLEAFERPEVYDKLQNARREASFRPLSLALGGLGLVRQTITLATFAALLWSIAWWAVFLLGGAALLAFLTDVKLATDGYKLISWRAPEGRRLNYLEWILTRDSHVKEVKLFGLGPLIFGRYHALFEKFYAEDRALALRRFGVNLVTACIALAAFYACYAQLADRAAVGGLSLGDLTLALAVLRQGQTAFENLLALFAQQYEHALYLSNLFAFLGLPVSDAAAPPNSPMLPPGPHALTLERVSFRYPGKTAWALRDLSLTIAPGEKLALVGENGAGKSTLIKLLLRLYEPTEGRILYGGVDVRELDPVDFRKRFSAVFQDFVRYQFSANENVGLGELKKLEDAGAIAQAIHDGGADEVVAGLPRQGDTVLGTWFDDAAELSAGQWQKLAVARAFMRSDAEILILDEPTASIDAQAEAAIFERFATLAKHRSAVIISHRFSTVRLADRIVVLEGGALLELGSHVDLVARGGTYARLFEMQARGYR